MIKHEYPALGDKMVGEMEAEGIVFELHEENGIEFPQINAANWKRVSSEEEE